MWSTGLWGTVGHSEPSYGHTGDWLFRLRGGALKAGDREGQGWFAQQMSGCWRVLQRGMSGLGTARG